MYLDVFPHVVLIYINEPLRNHHRNPVFRIAQPFDKQLHSIEALPKHLMAECKICRNFAHNRYLVVFNNLICHE